MFCNTYGWSQKKIQSAKVMYVNFLTMSDSDVSCSDFESVFKYRSIFANILTASVTHTNSLFHKTILPRNI